MSNWFVIHDLLAYTQHKDMIGNSVKSVGVKQPRSSNFSNIKKGDTVVYYAAKDYVVVGIFQVTSDIEYLPDDKYWKEIMIYRIKPINMPKEGYYLNFKQLVKDPKVKFDLFPDKSLWGTYLQGKTSILLTDKDYSLIENALTSDTYLSSISNYKVGLTNWHKKKDTKDSKKIEPQQRIHQQAIDKWKREQEKFFGLFKPTIEMNNVDINDILPKDIWLSKNKKYLDAISTLEVGGQVLYQSILEVEDKGSKEDLCVRVSIVLPFVDRVDIIAKEEMLDKIKELLERIADPHIVKTRVKFYSFEGFLGTETTIGKLKISSDPKEYFPQ